MPIDFPNSPTVNQLFTVGPRTWQWNGSTWNSVGSTDPVASTSSFSNGTFSFSGTFPTNLFSQEINNPAPGTIFKVYITGTYTNNSGSARTATLNCFLGSTTAFSIASPSLATNATARNFNITLTLISLGSTSQRLGVNGSMSSTATGGTVWNSGQFNLRSDANLSVNTSSSQTFRLQWTNSGTGTTVSGSYIVQRILP
jgi:hypothetical protein